MTVERKCLRCKQPAVPGWATCLRHNGWEGNLPTTTGSSRGRHSRGAGLQRVLEADYQGSGIDNF